MSIRIINNEECKAAVAAALDTGKALAFRFSGDNSVSFPDIAIIRKATNGDIYMRGNPDDRSFQSAMGFSSTSSDVLAGRELFGSTWIKTSAAEVVDRASAFLYRKRLRTDGTYRGVGFYEKAYKTELEV